MFPQFEALKCLKPSKALVCLAIDLTSLGVTGDVWMSAPLRLKQPSLLSLEGEKYHSNPQQLSSQPDPTETIQ
jgi:hypothetical protein